MLQLRRQGVGKGRTRNLFPARPVRKLSILLARFLFARDHGEVAHASTNLRPTWMANIFMVGGLVCGSPAEKNFVALAYSGEIVDRTRQSQ